MRLLLVSLAVALLLALPGTALAAGGGGDAIIKDCTDNGTIDHTYTKAQYDAALKHLPADVQEYTNCEQQIHDAAIAAAGKKKSAKIPPPTGGGGSGSGYNGSGGFLGGGGGYGGGSGPHGSGGSGAGAGGLGTGHSGAGTGNAVPASQSAGGSGGGGLPTIAIVAIVLAALAALGGAAWATRERWLPAVRPLLDRVGPRLGRVLPRRQP